MPTIRARVEENPTWKGAATATTPYRISSVNTWVPGTGASAKPGRNRATRDDEITGINATRAEIDDGGRPTWSVGMRAYPNQIVPFLLSCGMQPVSGYPKQGNGTNAVHTITPGGTISGGTWTFTFTPTSETSPAINWNSPAAEIQAVLERMAAFRPGDVKVTGGPVSSAPVVVTYQGKYAATVVGLCTVSAVSLTGSSPTLTPTSTTAGVVGTNTDSLGNGAVAGAYIWELEARSPSTALGNRAAWMPLSLNLDVDYGGGQPQLFAQGCVTTSLSMGQDGGVSASGPALYAQRFLTPQTYTPVIDADSVRPLLFSDLTVAGWGGGSTCDINGLTWQLSSPAEVTDNACVVSGHPGRAAFTGYTSLAGSVNSAIFDQTTWDAMVAASTFTTTVNYRSSAQIASTGVPYRMTLYMPATQIGADGGPEDLQNKLRHGATWPWQANYAQASGFAQRIIVVNAVPLVGVATADSF